MADSMERIKHVVVLMLENRSFDNMLGHLSLDGRGDIDGVQPGMSNEHEGRVFEALPFKSTELAADPPHGPEAIDDAVNGGQMDGFVREYAQAHPNAGAGFDPGAVMGYHTAEQLPVYSHLAAHFTVCDRWFSSVPGSTWPNRLYAVAGTAPDRANRKPLPIYDESTVFRHLDEAGVSWRWYAHDPGTLRALDGRYRLGHDDNYAYFNRRTLLERRHFLDDAREGKLPSVAWIDPNFVDLQVPFDKTLSNDDHPPSDVLRGQQLVLDVYNAVARGPAWDKTMLVITYDEHGGFFDHVPPPAAEDDREEFRRLGVRVPALVVSPYVEPASVAPREPVFDHSSIIRTILLRFCRRPDGTVPEMTRRVAAAHDLWPLLTSETPRSAPLEEIDALIETFADRQRASFVQRRTTDFVADEPLTLELNPLQQEVVDVIKELRQRGLPANTV